ncbi:MAG: hypothetical protein WD232_10630, partial [Acidimicrobiales bacterium]
KVRVRVDAGGLSLNGERFTDDDLQHLMMRIADADAGNGATSVTVSLTGRSGASVKARMSAATAKRGAPIMDAADYLWRFVRAVAGPRWSAELVARLADGEEVTVGGVVLAPGGIRDAKRRVAALLPWSSVADPRIDGVHVAIPGFDVDGVVVRLDEPDSFVLFEAIPELRARFAD